jgi:uncharacterized coiled-coil protein SlyX
MENPLENLEARLQESEIRFAFLERELEAYKDAVSHLHERLMGLEKRVRELKDGESSRKLEEFWKPEEP